MLKAPATVELPDLRTREEIRQHVNALLSQRSALMQSSIKTWHDAKRVTLVLMLIAAYLQYYFFDLFLEMLAWPATFLQHTPVQQSLALLSRLV